MCQWYELKTENFASGLHLKQRAVKDGIKPAVSWESFKIKILYELGKLKVDPLTYMFMYILIYAAEKKNLR